MPSFYQISPSLHKSFLELALGDGVAPAAQHTTTTLHQMAHLYQEQGKYEQAEVFYQRTLTIREKALGPKHPRTAESLHCMARKCQNSERDNGRLTKSGEIASTVSKDQGEWEHFVAFLWLEWGKIPSVTTPCSEF